MKKILFIHHASGWGGAPKAMIRLIKNLDYSKYDIEVLLIKNSVVAEKLRENGIKYRVASSKFYQKYYFGFIHSEAGYYRWYQFYHLVKSSFFWILSRYFFANKELKKIEFDIAHLNSSIMSDWLAPAKKKSRVIIHIREPFRKGKIGFLHYIFTTQMRKYADLIIAISEDNAKRIGIPEKTEVVYDFSELSKMPDKNSYNSKKVLYMGGASYIKGFYTIVEALNYLDNDVKVYFCGNYNLTKTQNILKRIIKIFLFYDKKLKTTIQEMRDNKNATEIGLIFEVQKYLDEVCCLVSPFLKPHFSLPVVEAFINYKPVIVTDIKGANEVVKHGINGIIVPVNEPQKLAEAINYVCNNGNVALKMGWNGHQEARIKYSPLNISKLAHIYDSL